MPYSNDTIKLFVSVTAVYYKDDKKASRLSIRFDTFL